MSYRTRFEGELKFTIELADQELFCLMNLLGEDRREHPEWDGASGFYEDDFYYVDIALLDDFSGIKWNNESESTYGMVSIGMVSIVNMIIAEMRRVKPDFGLTGEMRAQGEELGDCWRLVMEDGKAIKVETPPAGEKIECPECGHDFYWSKP